MDDERKPGPGPTQDTEGHGRYRTTDADQPWTDSTDDAEGHGTRKPAVPEDEDAEGHIRAR